MPVIEAESLSKRFGGKAVVDNVSFSMEKGETLVLLGTSGSGKTTTLKMINRLIEPSAGEVKINGSSIGDMKPEVLRRGIGYVIQHIGLFPHYTVGQNIGLTPGLLGWPKEKIEERTSYLLDLLNLDQGFISRFPHELSGGQQQRVGVARALAADPAIILLDEPFGALDPITRKQVRDDFANLEELQPKTMILVTHDVAEAFTLGDRICLMDGGRVQQHGKPQDLLFRPVNDFVRHFFSGDRLTLELMVTTLDDVRSWLKGPAQFLQPDVPLSDLLSNGDVQQSLQEDVLNAFYQYKASIE